MAWNNTVKRVISRFVVFICIMLLMYSCDNIDNIDGLVIDDVTKEPIDSALVYVKFKDKVLDSFSFVQDSINKTQREALIKKNGNDPNWIDTGFDKMVQRIPSLTDSNGKFDIAFTTGAFPNYILYLEKSGYETFEIKNKQINWNERPKIFRLKRKSEAQ
ncbi:MAG: hypothetical protein FD155_1780 [Bacteroidetes bacterium]|nr:MAG: hypothetical protein FD155_1780 [Bacteroidota bacterium]